MNNVLGNVLKLIGNNIGTQNAPWMNRIASRFHFTEQPCLQLAPVGSTSLNRLQLAPVDSTSLNRLQPAPVGSTSLNHCSRLHCVIVSSLPALQQASDVPLMLSFIISTNSADHCECNGQHDARTLHSRRQEAACTGAEHGEGGGGISH